MEYRLIYTEKAQNNLRKLEPQTAKKILKKLDSYINNNNPLGFAKKLVNTEDIYWRFRIGDYRAIFKIDNETGNLVILVILKIGHRKNIYNS